MACYLAEQTAVMSGHEKLMDWMSEPLWGLPLASVKADLKVYSLVERLVAALVSSMAVWTVHWLGN